MKTFSWKDSVAAKDFAKHDAQAVGEELERLRESHGSLEPSHVVERARSRKSALHDLFPWDDAEAAKRAREMLASQLIRSITVTIERVGGTPIETRAFVSTKTKDKPRHFTSASIALEDEEARSYLLREAMLQLRALRRRYSELSELATVFDAIDEVSAPSRIRREEVRAIPPTMS